MGNRRVLRPFFLFLAIFLPLLAGAVSGCLPAGGFPDALGISEVVSSNARSLRHEQLGSPDWIELYNGTNKAVNLAGYGLSDNIRAPHKWVFPDIAIQPGQYLLVYAARYDNAEAEGLLCTGFKLAKSGETLLLSDQYYNIISEVTLPRLREDVSYALNPATGRYGYSGSPTPGAANEGIVDSLDMITYLTEEGALQLTECVPGNTAGIQARDGRYYDFLELHNRSDAPVDLSRYFLSDDPANFAKWRLPEVMLEAGGYQVVYLSGKDGRQGEDIHAGFRLSDEDSGVYLSDAQGAVIGELHWDIPVPNNLAVVLREEGSAYCAYPTPGAPNSDVTFEELDPSAMDAGDPVRLNEVLVRNRYGLMDADGDRCEWVELCNVSAQPVSLLGYWLSDKEADLARWPLPDVELPPGEYVVVFLSGKDRREGELHANFRLSADDAAVILTDLNGLRTDALPLDPDMREDVSLGPDAHGGLKYYYQPTPGGPNSTAAYDTLAAVPRMNLGGVYISEVSAASPPKSGRRDWVELHNSTSAAVDLAGWYLSDSPADPQKFQLPSIAIASGGYALVYASSSTADQSKQGVTAPFNISAGGETLLLYDPAGQLADHFETGVLTASLSSGRDPAHPYAARLFYATATPSAPNAQSSYSGYAAAPLLSAHALYHTSSFELTITCATPGASIYYTTDGSIPTASSTPYTQPVAISKNTPLRAVAIAPHLLPSPATSATYLFEEPHTLPVVCLSGNPDAIRQVYSVTDRWNKIEREGHCAYYEAGGALGVKFPCGLRVNGASTLTMRQKSLSIYLRGGYGRSSLTYPFFGDYPVDTFSSLVLRNSGQDASVARMRDSFFSLAVAGLNIETVATRPVVVYINGEYWGIYDLNENQNEDYLAAHYGADPDSVEIIRRNTTALEGNNRDFKRVRSFGLNRNLADDALFAEFLQWVDEDYFIDYLIAQTFFTNGDMFNQKYWHTMDNSIKWRPVYFDLDFGLRGSPTRSVLNAYFNAQGVPSQDQSLTNMDIFVGLRKNAGWRDRFCARYVDVVLNHFTPERLLALLDNYAAALRPEMARHIGRWSRPSSVAAWERSVQELRETLEQRGSYALQQLRSSFGLSDAQMASYRAAAGH